MSSNTLFKRKSTSIDPNNDDDNSAMYPDPKLIGTWNASDLGDQYPIWKRRLVSSIWLTLSIILIWITDIVIHIVYLHESINLPFLITGSIFTLLFISIFFYLNFYIPYKTKKRIDFKHWQRSAPRLIPIATMCCILSTIFFMAALWPIYGWFCMPLFFVWSMGTLTVLAWF